MEWLEKMNAAVNYLEAHMTEETDYEKLGRIAGCSAYHFQRMFTYIAGVTLSEYIRRRKMTLAAVELQGSNEKIIDIALKYGYDSPTAFNRAFQAIHGVAPSVVKTQSVSLKAFSPIQFKMVVKGVESMNYRIEKKEAFRIIGVSEPLKSDVQENFQIVPKMWQTAMQNGTIPKLASRMNTPLQGLLGVSTCNQQDEWRYYIAVAEEKEAGSYEQEAFDEYMVPAATWAIFSGTGANEAIQELEARIITEWLPTSGYEYANAPDVEVFIDPDPTTGRYEVWIPVVKK